MREEPGVAHRGGDWDGQARWRRVCGACGHGAITWSVACTSHAYRRVFPRHGGDVTPHHSHPRHGQEAVQGADRAIACEQPLCSASTGHCPSPRIRAMSSQSAGGRHAAVTRGGYGLIRARECQRQLRFDESQFGRLALDPQTLRQPSTSRRCSCYVWPRSIPIDPRRHKPVSLPTYPCARSNAPSACRGGCIHGHGSV